MQIVIDIPNSLYANLSKIQRGSIASKRILDCVRNGKVLPKHGRLVDIDILYRVFQRNVVAASAFEDLFKNAPTVLDTTEEQE